MAYGCEILFDAKRAAGMREMIERATGLPCPCKRGEACMLLARDLVALPTPAVRSVA